MNVGEHVIFGATMFPKREAIVFDAQRLTYAQIERLSSQAAQVLQQHGVARGDRVALVLPNVPAFVVWYYAALRLGAIAVSISTRLAHEEVAFILADCEAQVVVVDDDAVKALRDSLPKCVETLLAVSDDGDPNTGSPLASGPRLASPACVACEPHDPAVILYTSGTTGFPKGATLSHQNVRATVHAFNHLCQMCGGDRLLLTVPLFHCFGQNALLNAGLHVGATLILQRRFDLNESKQLIADERVTKLFGVPTTFQLLWECCDPADLSSIGYCFSAAAALPIQLSRRWQEKFGMPIHEGYGLTETAPFASYNHRTCYVPGSIGTPVDLVEMKIVDPETGEPCPPETPGEIAIRGPNVMLGYWNRPEETAAALRDGWFHSGDVGQVDKQGYFYLVDRLKDMIAVGGTKVFPAEVERVLLDHPAIAEAAVVGLPDDVFGERVVAFLVAAASHVDVRQVQRHCRQHLAGFKVPRQLVLVDELPRNPTGKILKTRLRELDLTAIAGADGDGAANFDVELTGVNGAAALKGEIALAPLVERLGDVHAASRQRAIVAFIQEELQEMAGLEHPPDPEEKLVESGLDSLLIVELRDRLQLAVGEHMELPATVVFDYPRICDLAAFLLDGLQLDGQPQAAGPARGNPAAHYLLRPDAADEHLVNAELHDSTDHLEVPSDIESMTDEQALSVLLRELND